MRRQGLVVVAAVMALIASACAPSSQQQDSVVVVATTTILGDVVANVVADAASVIVLMPIGADPHDFQPSASQVASINDADLVVANGLFLEEGLEDVLEAASADGVAIFEVGPLLDPLPFAEQHDDSHRTGEHEGEHSDDHGSLDPHVWFDPIRMADAARLIAAQLTEVAPGPDWDAQAEAYARELLAADDEIDAVLSAVPLGARKLVTSHDSLGYFADRYGFDIVGTVIPAGSTVASPSSEALAQLVETMRAENVTAVFGETTQPDALAETVAAELGEDVQVVSLFTGSLGEPGTGADSLIGLLTTNAERIAEALGG